MRLVLAAVAASLFSVSAQAEWHQAQTRHFVIDANAKPDAIERYAQRLERFDATVRLLIGRPDPQPTANQKLHIMVLPSQEHVGNLVGRASVAGVYLPRVSGATAFVPAWGRYDDEPEALSAEAVFFHEYLHHLMLQDMTVVYPLWVSEGFAELFATARIAKDGAVTVGAVPQYRLASLKYATFPVEPMLAGTYGKLSDEEISRLYGTGWLLSHYLTFGEQRKGQLRVYLDAIGKGVRPLPAAQTAFGDLKKLAKELDDYRVKQRLSAVQIAGRAYKDSPVSVRAMSAGEAAMMPVVMRSQRGVDQVTAVQVVADARRIAATFPNDGAAQSALAEAEYDARDYAASLAAAGRAVTLRSDDVHGWTYKGMAEAALADTAKPKGDWSTARTSFVQANKVAGENAWPLMLYYKTFMDSRETPTPEAIGRLRRAFQLYPADEQLRLMLFQQLLREREFSDARRVLEPLLYNPHGGVPAEKAATILDLVSAGKTEEALSALAARRGVIVVRK